MGMISKRIIYILILAIILIGIGTGIGWTIKPEPYIQITTRTLTDTTYIDVIKQADTIFIDKLIVIDSSDKIDDLYIKHIKSATELKDTLNLLTEQTKIIRLDSSGLFVAKPYTSHFEKQYKDYKVKMAYKFPEDQILDFKLYIPPDTTEVIREINKNTLEIKQESGMNNYYIAGLVLSHASVAVLTAVIINNTKE